MPNITKRKCKGGYRYRALIRLRGHPDTTATFDRLTDAKQWAQETAAAIRAGRYIDRREAREHTLGDLIDAYIQKILPHKPKVSVQQGRQLGFWKKKLGGYALNHITPALIAEERDGLLVGRQGATVNRYLAALSHAFTIAVKEWGWLDTNPVRNVRRPREPRGRVRMLSADEQARLLEACRASGNPQLQTIVVLAIYTGMRQGEILGLRWEAVDLQRRRLVIHESKNGERRGLALAGPALEVMIEHGRLRRLDTDLVFPSPKTPTRPVDIRSAWDGAVRHAELKDFRFHDLRHTAASYLAMSGASLAEIAEILGHKTLAMVKRYSHITEGHSASVMERMASAFPLTGQAAAARRR